MSWALFVAGVSGSVITQWKVSDDGMNKLMTEFYRQMQPGVATGRRATSKAQALRLAQLSLIGNAAYKHPYYWAPVVLVGDWR